MSFSLSSRQLDTLHRGAVKTCMGLGVIGFGLTIYAFANMFKNVKEMRENPGSDLKPKENQSEQTQLK